jgi:hypothetical protein
MIVSPLRPPRLRVLLCATLCTALLLGVAGCGKKGAPKPPVGEESSYTYPQAYPAPETVTPGAENDPADGNDPFSIFSGDKRTRTKTY